MAGTVWPRDATSKRVFCNSSSWAPKRSTYFQLLAKPSAWESKRFAPDYPRYCLCVFCLILGPLSQYPAGVGVCFSPERQKEEAPATSSTGRSSMARHALRLGLVVVIHLAPTCDHPPCRCWVLSHGSEGQTAEQTGTRPPSRCPAMAGSGQKCHMRPMGPSPWVSELGLWGLLLRCAALGTPHTHRASFTIQSPPTSDTTTLR